MAAIVPAEAAAVAAIADAMIVAAAVEADTAATIAAAAATKIAEAAVIANAAAAKAEAAKTVDQDLRTILQIAKKKTGDVRLPCGHPDSLGFFVYAAPLAARRSSHTGDSYWLVY